MSDKNRANLLAILDAIGQIEKYTDQTTDAESFYENRMIFDATLMNFVLIGEMCDR